MIERETAISHHLPPGFCSEHWPPLKATRNAAATKPSRGQRVEDRSFPDLQIPAVSSSDGLQSMVATANPSSEAVSMVEENPTAPFAPHKAKLLASGAGVMELESGNEWVLEEQDVIVDRSESVPKVTFSPRTHERLAANMSSTVIIRLMGRNIGCKSLQYQIGRLWKPIGVFHLVDLGNNWFLVRFESPEDYLKSLTQGPWMLFGVYLVVQPWTPSFHPESTVISSIVAWIRFPNLPLHYYHAGVLKSIAEVVGKVFKVDRNTSSLERGKYARFAVGLDLSGPLIPHIEIDGRKQKTEYEGLPQICFHCGIFGHIVLSCPKLTQINKDVNDSQVNSENSGYGPEMLATKRGRRPAVVRQSQSAKHESLLPKRTSGSRYDILSEEECMVTNMVTSKNSDAGKEVHHDLNSGASEGGEQVVINHDSSNDNHKDSNSHPPPTISQIDNPSSSIVKKSKRNKTSRESLGRTLSNARSLDPSKHTVSIILDDQTHYGPPAPILINEDQATGKENTRSNGPNRGRQKGISLAQNMRKSLKVKKAKVVSSALHSNGMKSAILESLESDFNGHVI